MSGNRREILTDSSDTLRGLAQKYLGDFELWESIADLNDVTPFENLSNIRLQIPDISEVLESAKATLVNGDFEDLSTVLKTANNWKSLRWL